MINRLQIVAERQACWGDSVRLFARNQTNGRSAYGMPLVFSEREDGHEVVALDPFLTIPATAAQELMDSLWTCGLRPSEGAGSAGALAATERHLRDMQRLVFNHLKVSE